MSSSSVRPPAEILSRPMVDPKLLSNNIPSFKVKIIADSTGKSPKSIKGIVVHPIEWDAKIVFLVDNGGGRNKNNQNMPIMLITRVKDFHILDKSTMRFVFNVNMDLKEYWI